MIVEGLLVYLAVTFLFFVHYYLGNILTDRPLIVGTVVGFVLGDIKTGIIAGGTYELIFLGATNAGGVVPANTALGTAVGVAMSILSGMDMESSLVIAMPTALLGANLITLMYTLRSSLNPYVDSLIEKANTRAIGVYVYLQGIISYLIIFFPLFLVIAFGTELVESIVNSLPYWLTGGLSVASGMLAAVGIGMLLKMVWAKQIAPYFFVGYVLSAFLGMPVLGVAISATVYVVIQISKELSQSKGFNALQTETNGKEDLFND